MFLWGACWVGITLLASCGVPAQGLVKEMSLSGSSWNKVSPESRLSVVDWNAYDERDNNGPGTYSFGYDIEDPDSGNTQFRQEERLQNGTVTGSYGLVEPGGNVRIVHYVADERGYRVRIENSIRKEDNYPRRTGGRKTPSRSEDTSFDKEKPVAGDAEWLKAMLEAPGMSATSNALEETVSPALASAVLAQSTGKRPAVHENRRRPSSAWDSPAFPGRQAPLQLNQLQPDHTPGWGKRQDPPPAPFLISVLSNTSGLTKPGATHNKTDGESRKPGKSGFNEDGEQLYRRILQQQLNQDRELDIQDLFPPVLLPSPQEPQPQKPDDQTAEQNTMQYKGKQRKKVRYVLPAVPLLVQEVMPQESLSYGRSVPEESQLNRRYDNSWLDRGTYRRSGPNGFTLPPIPRLDRLIYKRSAV